jgi:hypothetical protein
MGGVTQDEFLKREASSYLKITIRRLWKNIGNLLDKVKNPMDCFLDIAELILKTIYIKMTQENVKDLKFNAK